MELSQRELAVLAKAKREEWLWRHLGRYLTLLIGFAVMGTGFQLYELTELRETLLGRGTTLVIFMVSFGIFVYAAVYWHNDQLRLLIKLGTKFAPDAGDR